MAAEIRPGVGGVTDEEVRFNEAAANGRGNLSLSLQLVAHELASMRPRRMAAEIERIVKGSLDLLGASMRPRRMAAEILVSTKQTTTAPFCFNEAAANGRGNRTSPSNASSVSVSFNEAAANGRGNRTAPRRSGPNAPCFNEAAANGRGNHAYHKPNPCVCGGASMRPRRMAAEIDGLIILHSDPAWASMRPRRMAAEISSQSAETLRLVSLQ